MNKRGQFYIIAAIIIVVAISGLATVVTYAVTKPTPKSIQSLSTNLKNEGPRIVDYGIYKQINLIGILNNFTDQEFAPYFLKKANNANVVFIYGNKSNLYAVQYNTTSTGKITASLGGQSNWYMAGTYSTRVNLYPSGNNINVSLLNNTYTFYLKEGEMFYFVIVQQKEGETYVEKN
jgi:hypothetical protein